VIDLGSGFTAPFPPSRIVGNQLAWNLGTLGVNANNNWRVTLRLDSAAPVGTVITNCATIAMSDFEDNPYDNDKCVTETVRTAGTNLRVTKFAEWQGQGGLRYRINIENIGTKTVNNVMITDTFPVSLTLKNKDVGFWEQWSSGVSGNQLTVTLIRLEPGWNVNMNMQMSLDSPVPNGTLFTNTVDVTTPPDDVNPSDNRSVLVVGTGPDLSIEKWLTAGTPKPGQLLTYTLHFRNNSPWQTVGNVWVTDTLSAGLEPISVTQRLCGGEGYFCDRPPDQTNGTSVAWNYGQWGDGWWNDLVITVRVTDTAKGGAVFTNTATVASDDLANDVEPFYNNNTAVVTAAIVQYKIYLPVIMKQ
jgi:uncharacterized repeat protein (TIGR01451 family)